MPAVEGGAPLARDVGRTLQLFSRAARARHLYRANNAALTRIMNDLNASFAELLGKVGELSLRVRPDAFMFEDQRVFEEPNPDESIPFAFFRDGIRRIDFSRGITPQELETLVLATASGFGFSGLGDDIVSFLWRHDLEHVHYVVVDTTIVDAELRGAPPAGGGSGGTEVDIDAQIDGLLAMIYGGGKEDVGPKSIHVDGSDLAAKSIAQSLDAGDEYGPGFHPVRSMQAKPSYVTKLASEVQAEDEAALQIRILYAALEAMAAAEDVPEVGSIGQGLLDLFDAALVSGDLTGAARIVAAVRGLAEIPSASERVEAWINEAIVETRLRPLTANPGRNADSDALLDLFRACGPRAVPSLLAVVPSLQDPVQRRGLVDVALEIGLDSLEPVRNLIASDQAFVALEGVYLLSQIPTKEARDLLWKLKDHEQAQVRLQIVELADKLPRNDAHAVADAMLSDPDPRVAAAATRLLAKIPDERSILAIEQVVRRPELLDAPLDLKEAVLLTYARLNGAKALHLLGRYLQRAEGRSASIQAEELAIAAARALKIVGTPGAVMALKTAAGYWNKRVREEARETILKMREGA
jgi:hypothetical protein